MQVLPRYHISYQQRQTQTRLSIPSGEGYATILQTASQMSAQQAAMTNTPQQSQRQQTEQQHSEEWQHEQQHQVTRSKHVESGGAVAVTPQSGR